jgi:lipopolysaccharide/colanic/teichoic acid biosynthesis glycosyltransferase
MQEKLHRQALLFIDLALIAMATVAALELRDNFEVSLTRLEELLPYVALTLASAIVVLLASGLHRSLWRFSTLSDYLGVLAGVVVIVVSAVAIGFHFNRLDGIARALPIIQALLMAFLMIGVRVAMRLRRTQRLGIGAAPAIVPGQETVLIVGLNTITDLFLRSVDEFAARAVKIAGIVCRSPRHNGRHYQRHPILGAPEDIDSILKTLEVHGVCVDRIVVTTPFSELSAAARKALLDIEKASDVRLDLLIDRMGLDGSSWPSEPAKALPLRKPEPNIPVNGAELAAALSRPYRRWKRALDLSLTLALTAALAPVLALVALLVVLDVGLPVVFWQQRPGIRGRPFKLYKFRTMGNAHGEQGRRIPEGERVSRIGDFLRRTRLDELPQLYNILVGEMSFVGPRPLLPADQPASIAARLMVRPGLTGWAQVSGGRSISASDKAALDAWYVRNASLALDLKIIAMTVPMLLFGEREDAESVERAWEELNGSRPVARGNALQASGSAKGRQHAA